MGMGLAAVAEAAAHPDLVDLRVTPCRVCHEDLLGQLPIIHPPAAEDCSACHRVEVQGGVTSITLVEAEPELCLGCHDADDLDRPHDGQLSAGGDCGGCHDAHGSENAGMLTGRHVHAPFAQGSCDACHLAPFAGRTRLRARDNTLCEECHGETVSGEESAGQHGALEARGGRAGCLNCHDPHLSENRYLLLAVGPAVCRGCHQEVVAGAEAPTGHAAAADDCLTCHLQHASARDHLLSEAPETLCGMCHDPGDEELRRAHLGADPAGLDCTECHSPHGAGQPLLLARVVHAPLLDGCDLCHEGSAESLIDAGGSALCAQCHDDVTAAAAASAFPHAALELAECSACHNPHAAAQESLVRQADGEVCVTCHEEQAPARDEVGHGVVEILGCQACHEPHSGERPKLLRVAGPDLCLACHDPRRLSRGKEGSGKTVLGRFRVSASIVRSMATLRLSPDGQHDHPVKGHRVLGALTAAESRQTDSTFRGELTCLTCHDPHKGRSEQLLRWNAATAFEACRHCHEK
jgi:predicted CXXCH cytochrome family protein